MSPPSRDQLDDMACSVTQPSIIPTYPPSQPNLTSYLQRPIPSLVPGPIRVVFSGIVVNIFGYKIDSSAPKAAKGCLKLLLRDSGGEILVKVWYAETDYASTILLGANLTVYTTHISATVSPGMSAEAVKALPASIMTSVFPDRDAGCAVHHVHGLEQLDEKSLDGTIRTCSRLNVSLRGLMDLEAFVNGAAENKTEDEVKLLVCVLSVGEVATITTRNGTTFQVQPIQVIDQSNITTHNFDSQFVLPRLLTIPVEISLSPSLSSSVATFEPKFTTLLITYPRLQSQPRRQIKLTPRSRILVNPSISESSKLQHWISRLYPPCNTANAKVSSLQQVIAEGSSQRKRKPVFQPKQGLTFQSQPPPKRQYTFALFFTQIHLQPEKPFTAYISVIITALDLVNLWQQGQLFSMTHKSCGLDCYSNLPVTECTTCLLNLSIDDFETDDVESTQVANNTSLDVELRFNPSIVAGLADETGGLNTCFPPPTTTTSSLDREPEPQQPSRHNLVVTDVAIEHLTGLTRDTITRYHNHDHDCGHDQIDMETNLRNIEDLVRWSRVTLVLGWTGETEECGQSGGGGGNEVVVLDVLT